MFGLFGGHRKAAVRRSVDALRPIVGIVQHNYGLPPRFWMDAYVLGFMHFSIGHFAKLATGGKIGLEDMGQTLVEAFTALSNMNGIEIARRAHEFVVAKDADFDRGADDASAVHYYSMGVLRNEANHPLVQRATAVVDRMHDVGPANKRAEIASIMMMLSFINEVKKRFELGE